METFLTCNDKMTGSFSSGQQKDSAMISIMVNIFVQPLVDGLCLILFHIQAGMDSLITVLGNLACRLFLVKLEPAKVLLSFWYAHLHATFTLSNVGIVIYYHLKLLENSSVTSGGYPLNHDWHNILSFEVVENPSVTSG